MHVIFLQFHLPPFLFCSLPWNLQCPFVFLFMGWWAMLWPLLHFRHEACALACLVSTAVFAPFKGKKNHLCKQIMQIISWKVLQNSDYGIFSFMLQLLFTGCPGMSLPGCSRVVFPPLWAACVVSQVRMSPGGATALRVPVDQGSSCCPSCTGSLCSFT